MKTFKIIFGILILYGAGTEYINASKQLASFLSPPIIIGCLVMIISSAWLIGSGLSQDKFQIRSAQFLKYFFIAAGAFIVFAFFASRSFKPEADIISANGVKVNIGPFMNGSRNIIPDEKERRNYCVCVVNRLTMNSKITTRFGAELENGDIDKIMLSVKDYPEFANFNINECMSSVKNFTWTETFEKSTRENLYQQLKNSDLAKTNNIDKYCDCLIQEYKKLPLNKITNPDFYQSLNFLRIDSLCNSKSKLK
jgi:hypothetical protein